MMLSEINKSLNRQLVAQKRKPILDEDPKGISVSDIKELRDAEMPELDMEAIPALPPPPNVPKDIQPVDVLSSISDGGGIVEELPSVPPPAEETDEVPVKKKKVKAKAAKKPAVVKARPVKKVVKKQEKSVSSKTKDTKVIATDIPVAMHERMEAFIKAHPDKAKTKRELVRHFIMRGLKNAKF